MNETLLLTWRVMNFRKDHPELIAQWERKIGSGNYHPGLHFCMGLVEDFPKLSAYVYMLGY